MCGLTHCASLSFVAPCVLKGQILLLLLNAGGSWRACGTVLLLKISQLAQLQRFKAVSLYGLCFI